MSVDQPQYTEKQFLGFFADLIGKIATIQPETQPKPNPLADLWSQQQGEHEAESDHMLVTDFIRKLDCCIFDNGLIPYNHITRIIFEKVTDDVAVQLFPVLREGGAHFFGNSDNKVKEDTKKAYYKILRHIELASIQKSHLLTNSQQQLDDLSRRYQELVKLNQTLETKNDELQTLITKIDKEAKAKYENMMTQHVSILGIFAAILMGVFGSVQAFTSLFNNANQLSYSKILILCSIGASSVILILFFLLNSLGKIVGKRLANSGDTSSSIVIKYPFLFISHGFLIFIALIGVSIELSNIKLKFAWQGAWWLLPILWFVFFLWILNKNMIKLFEFKLTPFQIFTEI